VLAEALFCGVAPLKRFGSSFNISVGKIGVDCNDPGFMIA
jgi:hypothetical protein